MREGSSWQDRLWQSLVAFETVQMEHHNAFASGRCEHLMERRATREKALARVQMQLEDAQHRLLMGENGDFAQRLRAKLAALIDREAALTEEVRKVRNHMLHELATLRQGSRVLKGYGQHHGAPSRPRLVNSKT
jgi:hypothetical protein